jgi:hypothetical protein
MFKVFSKVPNVVLFVVVLQVALFALLAAVAFVDAAPQYAAPAPSYGPAPLLVEPAYPDVITLSLNLILPSQSLS